jgi:hypothetical protein
MTELLDRRISWFRSTAAEGVVLKGESRSLTER